VGACEGLLGLVGGGFSGVGGCVLDSWGQWPGWLVDRWQHHARSSIQMEGAGCSGRLAGPGEAARCEAVGGIGRVGGPGTWWALVGGMGQNWHG